MHKTGNFSSANYGILSPALTGKTLNKALYVALAVNYDGKKEVLGLWLAENEGAKFRTCVRGSRLYKDLKEVCVDLKKIYSAATEDAGRQSLDDFGKKWKRKYPVLFKSWDTYWNDLIEFFKYPPEIRKAIYI